jgi:hypothetical protein
MARENNPMKKHFVLTKTIISSTSLTVHYFLIDRKFNNNLTSILYLDLDLCRIFLGRNFNIWSNFWRDFLSMYFLTKSFAKVLHFLRKYKYDPKPNIS